MISGSNRIVHPEEKPRTRTDRVHHQGWLLEVSHLLFQSHSVLKVESLSLLYIGL